MIFSIYDFYYIFLEIFLFFSCCLFIFFGLGFNISKKWGYPVLSISFGWICFFLISYSIFLKVNSNFNILYLFNFLIVNDALNFFSKIWLLFLTLNWILICSFHVKVEKLNFLEFWILILLVLFSMLILLASNSLLILYLTIEIQNLVFYILASIKRKTDFSVESSLKYFILSAISSILLLLGFCIFYGYTGLINFFDFNILCSSLFFYKNNFIFEGFFFGLLFIILSFLFKLGAAPFYFWLLDVYEGSPSNVTAFFSLIPKFTMFIIFNKLFLYNLQFFIYSFEQILLFSIFLSFFIGTFGALLQLKWKRFLAYSSLTHIAFLLAPFLNNSLKAIESFYYYLIVYLISVLGTFAFFLFLVFYNKKSNIRYFSDLFMIIKLNPNLGCIFILILFSMAGIPPLAGFFSKMFIFLILLEGNYLGLTFLSILLSCLACFYYLRLIKIMYFNSIFIWPFFKKNYTEQAFVLNVISLMLACSFLDINLILLNINFLSLYLV
uniref:NADH dehydrogenase subunit 2 n=1 Tax=Neorhodella cyanea TaxID=131155 RepID=UPI001FCCFDF8|nr:NADH dehydrogenase subunit 2 [Neorhodella cyanea]UNJ18805.1 NADH dehydrogenase subunit 2 [Neorhodella cyanea]